MSSAKTFYTICDSHLSKIYVEKFLYRRIILISNFITSLFKMLHGAIFDADGTLLNSMHIWKELGARYLQSLNIEPEEKLSSILYPMSLERSSLYLQKRYNLKFSPEEIQRGFLEIIEGFYVNEVELKPGVRDLLESLKRKNIPMVIATSGNRNLLQAALTRNNINQYFSKIFTCSELNTNKHEPKIFLACAEFLRLKPEAIAVFEDSLFAIRTAKAAGFFTVGIEDKSNIIEREAIQNESDFYSKNFI